jgi:hypothetical protein
VLWAWSVVAATTLLAVVVLVAVMRRVTREVRALHDAAAAFARVAVAVDDLGYEARRVERNLRRLAHR